jgi:hypothetical protein
MNRKLSVYALRSLAVAAVAGALWMTGSPVIEAQGGITITNPAASAVLKAGPDYATDVLADPWDFSNREDVAIDPAQIDGFNPFAVSAGQAGGTIGLRRDGTGGGSFFNVLQRAYETTINPGRTGARYPIASSAYTRLSFKMSLGNPNQFPRVFWFHNDNGPSGDASGWRYVTDVTVPATAVPSPTGNQIYTVDLTLNNNGVPWTSGVVKGFALYPNSTAEVGYQVQFDWVRLTTADAHPASSTIPVTWSGPGNATIRVTDAAGTIFTVATGRNSPFTWNYGVLPPGAYTMTITSGSSSGTRSFSINAPPTIQVTDPDETGGEDFATAVLGNAWDFNDQGDFKVDNNQTIIDHLITRGVSGGIFNGRSDGVQVATSGDGAPVGDPQLYTMSFGKNTDTTVINTSRYHRLSYRLQVDRAFDLRLGSVSRVFWGSQTSPTGGGAPYTSLTTTKDIITWPGNNTYTVDLAPLNPGPQGGLEALPAGATAWTGAPVRHFRLDPHEFAEQLDFHYDFVRLAADDETTANSFTIRFTGSDPNGGSPTVSLFRDTNTDPSSGLVSIASGIALSAGQYVWNTSSVPPGTYYIYAVVTDGLNSVGQYSTGPVNVVSFTPPSNVLMNIDAPADGATVTSAFEVGGWAIDTAASAGTGVDGMQFWIFPNNGASPGVFLGTGSYGTTARADVGAAFGSQFTNSAWHFTVTGMQPGAYVLGVFAHSTVSGQYTSKMIHLTVDANVLESIDLPSPEAVITAPNITVAGWAIDRSAPSGLGVDALHVYAYPNPGSGQAPIFLGVATQGFARQDVADLYGSRFLNSGYALTFSRSGAGLAPGIYNLVVWAHSTATGSFNNNAVVRVTLQ